MKKRYLFLAVGIACSLGLMAQTVTKFAGTGVGSPFINSTMSFSTATYYSPKSTLVDQSGSWWIMESNGNRVRMFDSIPTNVYSRAGNTAGLSGQLDGTGSNALFNTPSDMVMDKKGYIYLADAGNNCIRRIDTFINLSTSQVVSTFAGVKGPAGGYHDDPIALSALFNSPTALAIDTAGNIYVAEGNGTPGYCTCIRKITPGGAVTTFAGSLNPGNLDGVGVLASFAGPSGLGWYSRTELLVTDFINNNIRKVNIKTGAVTTIAGTGLQGATDGDALTQATFNNPTDVTIDTNKNIYVTDSASHTIRKITGSCVTTFAGTAGISGTTDGTGSGARFRNPTGIMYYGGALYVSDFGNNTIRKVTVPATAPAPAPIASFFVGNAGYYTNTTYLFHDSTSGTVNSRIWRFSPNTYTFMGGTDSTSLNAQVQFTATATYTVTLTDVNCLGKSTLSKPFPVTHHLGVNEVNALQDISIYPNPTNGLFEISLPNPIMANMIIRVMNISGKVVVEHKMLSNKETIDMGAFAKGIYILNISGNETAVNKKLIID